MLISQTDISQPDLTSSVHEAVGRDDVIMKAIKEYVLTTCSFYLSLYIRNHILSWLTREKGLREGRREEGWKEGGGKERKRRRQQSQ